MKEIPLSQNMTTIIDDEDFERLSKHKWCVHKEGTRYYACSNIWNPPKMIHLRMHRLILNAKKGEQVDHIDGNTLDNRKENLRIVTPRQNSQNRHQTKTSKYPGVYWNRLNKKWHVQVQIGTKRIYLGQYENEDFAYSVYKNYVDKLSQGDD